MECDQSMARSMATHCISSPIILTCVGLIKYAAPSPNSSADKHELHMCCGGTHVVICDTLQKGKWKISWVFF